VSSYQLPEIDAARKEATEIPLWILDRPGMTIQHVQAEVARRNAKYVVIDYIQRLNGPGKSEYERVTGSSLVAKDMTRSGVTVIALAQLNREVEKRQDKMPKAGDLRSSGQLEQDADIILGLLRDAVYDDGAPANEMTAGVIKARAGGAGRQMRLGWDGPTTTVSDVIEIALEE